MENLKKFNVSELENSEMQSVSGGYGLWSLWKDFITGVFLDAAWDTVVAWWEATKQVETVDFDATKIMQKRQY